MDNENVKKEIEELTNKINKYNELYFNDSSSVLTDYEYDCLIDELNKLEEQYPEYKLPNSPLNNNGEIHSNKFKKVSHKIPMLSLKKTYSFEEIEDFIKNINKNYNDVSYVCELKLDGISIDAHYLNNKLVTLSTRGDGYTGDDITHNSSYITNLPLEINSDIKDIHFRGEAIMKLSDFNSINKILMSNNSNEVLSNPRNTASGTLKLTNDTPKKNNRILTSYFYSIIVDNNTKSIHTQIETLNFIKKYNLPLNNTYRFCKNINDIIDYINFYEKEKDNIDIPIDGIVIKINEHKYYETLGYTNKHPKWAIAYKYKPKATSTKLINIEYTVGRTGVITPVANFEPVKISGTIIKKATLHNILEITRLGIRENDNILIKKSGEIIPKIIGVDITKRNINNKKINEIKNCPSCNEKLIQKNNLIYCPNKNCKDRIIESIKHFVSKEAMDIKCIGDKIINEFYKKGIIKSIIDIYKIKFRDIVRLPGFSTLSTKKLIDEINNSKSQPLYKFIYGIGIDGVGISVAKNLVEEFKSIENITHASINDILKVKLIGDELANNIYVFFKDEKNIKLFKEFKELGLCI